jgi:hypothetical protein
MLSLLRRKRLIEQPSPAAVLPGTVADARRADASLDGPRFAVRYKGGPKSSASSRESGGAGGTPFLRIESAQRTRQGMTDLSEETARWYVDILTRVPVVMFTSSL